MKDQALADAIRDLRNEIQTMPVDSHRMPSQVSGQVLDRLLLIVEHLHVRLDMLEATLITLTELCNKLHATDQAIIENGEAQAAALATLHAQLLGNGRRR